MMREVARGGQERRLAVFVAAVAGDRRRPRERRVDRRAVFGVEREAKMARGCCRGGRARRAARRRSPPRRPDDRAPSASRRWRSPTPCFLAIPSSAARIACKASQPPAASTKRRYFILLQSAISPSPGSGRPSQRSLIRPAGERAVGEQTHAVGEAERAHLARGAAVEQREADLVGDDRNAVPDQHMRDAPCRSW